MTVASTSLTTFLPGLVAALAIAVACAVLSVFVVSRRWAFIGEGIAHSGFGGAGTVWLLMLAFPVLREPRWALPAMSAGVVLFCMATALLIAYFSRAGRVNSDAAIGIFMVASLAWGILAKYVYAARMNGAEPVGWNTLLFGEMGQVTGHFALAAAAAGAAVVIVVAMLGKEILYYCFDPQMAEAAGVRAGFIHYLLMLLLAVTIVVGVRVAGSVLVTALLVLPGATGLLLSDRLRAAVTAAVVVGVLGAAGGVGFHAAWAFIPTGPAIVLVLFAAFVVAYLWAKVRRPVG